jgi:hypothetical protein
MSKLNAFITNHYQELDRSIYNNLRKCHSEEREEMAAQVWLLLWEVCNRLAFTDQGWQDETDCLRQSKTRIGFLCIDVMKAAITHSKATDSLDSLSDDMADGRVSSDFIEAISAPEDQSAESEFMRKEMHRAIRSCATSEYENALLDWVEGSMMKEDVHRAFSISLNTLTIHRNDLLARIREKLIIEGHV